MSRRNEEKVKESIPVHRGLIHDRPSVRLSVPRRFMSRNPGSKSSLEAAISMQESNSQIAFRYFLMMCCDL